MEKQNKRNLAYMNWKKGRKRLVIKIKSFKHITAMEITVITDNVNILNLNNMVIIMFNKMGSESGNEVKFLKLNYHI